MPRNSRFTIVNGIVEGAIELSVREREAYVLQYCGADAGLAAEVMALLALSQSADGFLEAGAGDLQPGDVLGGRFRIVEELGCGGAGTVFLVEDSHLGRVALKVVHGNLLAGGSTMDRVAAEVKAARAVSHPNVCPVFDLFQFDDAACGPIVVFTMKYLPGEALHSRLTRGPLDPVEALDIARGIASGLDALHGNGIVHCDLKPGNIVLTRANGVCIPVILDFGLATLSNSAQTARASGSPRYMAPEQFRQVPLTGAVDVYAFGVLLFEMIAGRLPFPEEDLVSAAIRRNTEEPPRLSAVAGWVPPGWDAAIALALARDPAARPRSAMEVIGMLSHRGGEESGAGMRIVRNRRCCSHRANRRFFRGGVSPFSASFR
jgi:serine/threonine protein kinase